MAGKALAKKAENLPSRDVLNAFFDGHDDGFGGVSRDDIALPRLGLLQALSKQVNKRAAEYIKGAEVGQIFNTATEKVHNEFTVVFSAYQRRYVEWIPLSRGGGLVRDHGIDASILQECTTSEEDGSIWHGDNEVVPTGTWYGIDPETMSPVFIAMGKTHLTSSKKIMSMVKDQRYFVEGKGFMPAPLFGRSWILSARERSNDKGTWMTWTARPGPWVPEMGDAKAAELLAAVNDMQRWIGEDRVTIDLEAGEDNSAPNAEGGAM